MLPRPTHQVGGAPALFLDVDGTLLDIAEAPDRVSVPARVVDLLARLAARGGALALVSGRSIRDLDGLLAPLRLPCAGLHGAERRDAGGRMHRLRVNGALDGARAALSDFCRDHPGTLLEDKGAALALHYRLAPQAEAAARRTVAALVSRLAPDFQLQQGKCVLELKPAGASKARAIGDFMAEPPFAGRIPVFVGDDATDEDGFRAVNAHGGLSVRVGPASDTAARASLDGVADVLDWLSGWLMAPLEGTP
ncbi:MAG: trehalose-phosphatase [Steroidobacteraceae bacterium]|jgi:trehalose 6-phosphate phosphatase|nr:trehalose-phosphatase [Steroidobacteraceae bacterium]